MSEQAIQNFFAQLHTDTELRQKLHQALSSNDRPSIVKFAKQRGHEFDEQELQSALTRASSSELSDAELDEVAGGGGIWNMSANQLMSMFLKLNSKDPTK